MRKRQLDSPSRVPARDSLITRWTRPRALDADAVGHHARAWLLDCEIRGLSPNTRDFYSLAARKLAAFLRERALVCDRDGLREFLAFVRSGGTRPRRGPDAENPRPASARTSEAYFVALRVFLGFLVAEGVLDDNPLDTLTKPVVRQDQVQPFTSEQVLALVNAARRTALPRRNEAILLLLLDTGARASELCGARVEDLDFSARCFTVQGKGGKSRRLYFSAATHRALWRYLEETPHASADPLFLSERGEESGGGLTRNGLLLLCRRLGKAAGVAGARCSPHTFRHTFAVNFIRNGGNAFTLKQLLGHTSLTMVNRYLALADADLEAQHRQYSPVEALFGKQNGRKR
jgi:integrase/recombinase XerC